MTAAPTHISARARCTRLTTIIISDNTEPEGHDVIDVLADGGNLGKIVETNDDGPLSPSVTIMFKGYNERLSVDGAHLCGNDDHMLGQTTSLLRLHQGGRMEVGVSE